MSKPSTSPKPRRTGNKPGRPALPKSQRLGERITITMDPETKQRIRRGFGFRLDGEEFQAELRKVLVRAADARLRQRATERAA